MILEIENLSADTKRMRLSFPRSGMQLGLPVGKHFKIYAPNPTSSGKKLWNDREDSESCKKEIERAYTPVTGDEVNGFVDLVIKMYRAGKVSMPDGRSVDWADGGKLTGNFLDQKKVGDVIEVCGPFGLIEYKGLGFFKLPGKKELRKFSHVGMMAGGTGITPMLQVLQAAFRDSRDTTEFRLIYANKTENDILCREMLLDLKSRSNGRLNIDFTLDFPPENWIYSRGFINQEMIAKNLPGPQSKPIVLLCGPPPMVEFACKQNLLALGYGDVVCF